MPARVFAVTNLKGGTSKSTSAAFLAHVWHGQGHRVLLVDADPQASSLEWSGLADWPVPALGLPIVDVHRRLPGITGDGYDVVVIDSPPLEEARGIVSSVMRAATDVVITMAPTTIELHRLAPVYDALDDVAPLRPAPAPVSVLLTRTITQSTSPATYRELLTEQGRYVLRAQVPRLERYAQAFGAPVPLDDGPYTEAAAELLARTAPAAEVTA